VTGTLDLGGAPRPPVNDETNRAARAAGVPATLIETGSGPVQDQIRAGTQKTTEHIQHLWDLGFRELALDCGRDPSDSNVAIVKIVSEMRLAEETRRMRIAAWAAVIVAAVAGAAAIAVALLS
jgi:hypothetical protein